MDVIKEKIGTCGVLTINRPEKLNALNRSVIVELQVALEAFAADEAVRWVLLEGSGDRAFCAGGDVVAVYREALQPGLDPMPFFADEFALDLRLHEFPKPVVAHYKGIVMGGGVGIGGGAFLRIADETTRWAMPETRLGIFPDVGVGYFISRLPRPEGLYLSLVGATINGAEALHLGLATDYIEAARWPDVRAALLTAVPAEAVEADVRRHLQRTVAGYAATPGEPSLAKKRAAIQRFFDSDQYDQFLEGLQTSADPFAREVLDAFAVRSPLSLAVVFEKYAAGKAWDRAETLARDFKLMAFFWQSGNMAEGIRATMVDKDNAPHFQPTRLEDVDPATVRALLYDAL